MSGSVRVLVVDDEPSTLKLLEYVLSKAGYEVHTATDGAEGLAAVSYVLPHLVVADVMMPQLDGLEMCRRIRQLPGFELVPFMFLSARSQIQDRIEGLEMGADDYIAKPFERDDLLARIEGVLRRAETYQKISRTDALTELGNREFFEQRLREELYREQRYGVSSTLALVAIDIDELGDVRDRHGSASADLMVKQVGRFLRDNVRALDVPTRYSTSGFIVLMPHTSKDRAMVAIERLSEKLNATGVHAAGGDIPIAASFGVAVVEGEMQDLSEMLNRAHSSMMMARRQAGSKVHLWSPEDEQPVGAEDGADSDRR
ncbi:MAG: response regulator [Armatimonadetes bacterium]|nr:response regulator [Armatimonadota bacterium]